MKAELHKIYLDWVNNWGSLSRMAQYYNVDVIKMDRMIHIGRRIHRS